MPSHYGTVAFMRVLVAVALQHGRIYRFVSARRMEWIRRALVVCGCLQEGPAQVARESGADLGMLVAAVVVEGHVDHLAGRHSGSGELLVPVARHAAADDRGVEVPWRF